MLNLCVELRGVELRGTRFYVKNQPSLSHIQVRSKFVCFETYFSIIELRPEKPVAVTF